MDEAPGSLGALRRLNRLRVLDTLRRRGSVSRADIARQTGLSRTTVSNLVGDLLAEGVVVEQASEDRQSASPNGGGRPAPPPPPPAAAGATAGGGAASQWGAGWGGRARPPSPRRQRAAGRRPCSRSIRRPGPW